MLLLIRYLRPPVEPRIGQEPFVIIAIPAYRLELSLFISALSPKSRSACNHGEPLKKSVVTHAARAVVAHDAV